MNYGLRKNIEHTSILELCCSCEDYSMSSSHRRQHHTDLNGRVLDRATTRGVPNLRVELIAAGVGRTVETDNNMLPLQRGEG